jgi:ketosteroid isomerase-like protein
MTNKEILQKANEAVSSGDNEGFLNYCTEDTVWNFIGDVTLRGKEQVRQWMAENYLEPPVNNVTNLLADGNFVIATGTISVKDKNGKATVSEYCDVWRFEGDKMAEVNAYVMETE